MLARQKKRLFVTGGAGFIGTNFVHFWNQNYPSDHLVVLDALTYAGNRSNLSRIEKQQNFRFVQGDISDQRLLVQLLREEELDTIVHFAAESHVDRSILGPEKFIQTNVVGTFNLLEAFRCHWEQFGNPSHFRFLHVSTDEVYGSLGPDDPAFCEKTAYAPNSPYAASKAGSDHLVRAYQKTYDLPTLITNCSNNYGAFQYPEKLIPLMIVNILLGRPLTIFGDGQNVRDWLYVDDHCLALDAILHRANPGENYNIGGNNEIRNIELVQTICKIMDELNIELPIRPSSRLITFVKDRLGHDRRYSMNASKLTQHLFWKPVTALEFGLRQTIQWYLRNRQWWEVLLAKDEGVISITNTANDCK